MSPMAHDIAATGCAFGVLLGVAVLVSLALVGFAVICGSRSEA